MLILLFNKIILRPFAFESAPYDDTVPLLIALTMTIPHMDIR